MEKAELVILLGGIGLVLVLSIVGALFSKGGDDDGDCGCSTD